MCKYIYALVNDDTNKIYIGSTKNNLNGRLSKHLSALRHNRHKNQYLQQDHKVDTKYSIYLLEITPDTCSNENREAYWMAIFNTSDSKYGYNLDDPMAQRPTIECFTKIYEGPIDKTGNIIDAEKLGSLILFGRERC